MAAPTPLSRAIARMMPQWFEKAVGGWLWPSQANPGWWGNGDRGPLGAWQMNINQPQGGLELVAFSAVYACVQTISSDVAKLPMLVHKVDQKTGARDVQRADYYAQLMRTPNDYQTHADLLQAFVQSYLLQGNTYCYAGQRNGRNEIEQLHVLNPYKVRPFITDGGDVFYECGENFLAGIKPNTMVPARDMIHHRLPLLPGFPLIGVTPIFAAAASSAVGIRILQDSQKFFANSARPSGILQSTINLGDDQKRKAKEEWDIAYRGTEYGKVAILPNGLNWSPITITQQDAQLIEQLRFSVEDVARVFRVPPFMLGDMTKVTYRNNEQLVRAYLTGCLGYHIEAIEERFERAFEFPPNFEIRFDLTALLRTEIDVRFTAYREALNAGWQSVNEVRAQEGLHAVKGGDEPGVQMQYVPLSQSAEPKPAPAPAPAPPPADDPAPDEPAPDDNTDEGTSINPARVRRLLRERLGRMAA